MNSSATPPPELYLPDLPEVAVSLRPLVPPVDRRQPQPWGQRIRNWFSSYLPLLLMAGLAGSTWWLVKHTPGAAGPAVETPVRHEPDYTMQNFSITRFDAEGRFALRIEGDVLRHYPDTDHFEVDGARIHAVSPVGRTTDASARRAVSNADASEVQLIGGAHVVSQMESGEPLQIDGEFLQGFLRFERLRTHLPVQVRRGADETHATGMEYDNLAQQLNLKGPVRSVFHPPGRPGPVPRSASPASGPIPTARVSP